MTTRTKKNRIVVKVVMVEYTSTVTGKTSLIPAFQEVYSSQWRVDCVNYINRQSNPEQYKIYVEDVT